MTHFTTFWINGRFLSRQVTGVERVAHEVLRALSENYLDAQGRVSLDGHTFQFKWALDRDGLGLIPEYGKHWEKKTLRHFTGHLWEQANLASFKPKDWLLHLCNTAPLFRRKQLVFFHDAQAFAIPGNFNWKFRFWYTTLIRLAGRCSKGLLTNSHFSKSELIRFAGLNGKKIGVMHLGTDHMARIEPALPAHLLAQIGEQPFVLAVSSASPNKNFLGVAQALQQLPHAPLCVIVGQRYDKVFQTADLIGDNLVRPGYVSDDALAALYQKAACLVYPSFYEGFGLPPLEAMYMGCPVVVSHTSSLPEVCGGSAYYCDPHSPTSIAHSISDVLALQTNREALDRCRTDGRVHAQSFTWQRSAGALLDAMVQAVSLEHSSR